MGKAVLILVLGSLGLFVVINLAMNKRVAEASEESFNFYRETIARNIANSTVEMLLSRVADENTYRQTTPATINNFFGGNTGGSSIYTVTDATLDGVQYIRINTTGTFEGVSQVVNCYAQLPDDGFVPAPVKAAISTNNPVSVLGTLTVDGRDHDINGNLIAASGLPGIWTTRTINISGNAQVGGTADGIDYAPSKPANVNTYAANQTYPGGYPSNPDLVLGGDATGFPNGTLKSMAQSGLYGSQYTASPGTLTYPLRGVTYVELPDDGDWSPANFDGSGILVVCNSQGNAKIGNINWGTFRGLLIADDIVRLHAAVIGAVVSLMPNPSDGNTIGNGSGSVLFSRVAISKALDDIISSGNFGFAKKRINIKLWSE